MEEWIRNNVLMCLEPLFEHYSKNITLCWNNDNKTGMETWIKQIEALINFIDGVEEEDYINV